MSLALERVCATLDLPVQDDPPTRTLVAKKIIELAQRGLRGKRAEFYHSEGVQIRRMTGAAGFPGSNLKMRQLLDEIVSSRDERLGVTERTRHQHERVRLHRTMQEAIRQQLKKEYEPPMELTDELATLLAKMDDQENERK